MKENLTELVFILDRSGSMIGLEEDTIGGFNGLIEKQRGQAGEANVTTVLFDDRYEQIHDRLPISSVKPLTKNEYYVRGCTALLDAVGKTISKMESVQARLPESEKAEKLGISADRSVTFENDSQGIEVQYRGVEKALGCMRAMTCMSAMDSSWKAEIEEDVKARKRKGRK